MPAVNECVCVCAVPESARSRSRNDPVSEAGASLLRAPCPYSRRPNKTSAGGCFVASLSLTASFHAGRPRRVITDHPRIDGLTAGRSRGGAPPNNSPPVFFFVKDNIAPRQERSLSALPH